MLGEWVKANTALKQDQVDVVSASASPLVAEDGTSRSWPTDLKAIAPSLFSASSTSSKRRVARLQAKLDAAKRVAELEEKEREERGLAQRKLIDMQLAVDEAAADLPPELGPSSMLHADPSPVGKGCHDCDVSPGVGPPAPSATNDVGALAEAFVKAIQLQKSDQMDNFLARQSTGKELPTFSGNPEYWPVFAHLFRSSTETCGFSDAENLGRLNRALKGKAMESVLMLLCISGNVPKILKHLEQRFGRGDLVIQRLITKAKDCRAVRLDDMESLLDFHAAVESLTECMKLLKHTGHTAIHASLATHA